MSVVKKIVNVDARDSLNKSSAGIYNKRRTARETEDTDDNQVGSNSGENLVKSHWQ